MDYNLLVRWFVGLNADDEVWDPTVFTKNRDRLLQADVAQEFLARVVEQVRAVENRQWTDPGCRITTGGRRIGPVSGGFDPHTLPPFVFCDLLQVYRPQFYPWNCMTTRRL